MKKTYTSIRIALFAIVVFSCSDDDDSSYPVYDREVTVAQNDSILVDLGAYPIEGGREISEEARHAKTSELRAGNYFYKPEIDFMCEDQVEITSYGSTGGNDIFPTGVVRITLLVSVATD
ncbi:hypothetical protein [Flavimarina sp. Hel_I_48]|uniref:hypothetical protein n=1 Tax=Flavimarina sp. Hel_I_48 TaxID=1392488 RepID=UPI0004DF9451|nr:hypothetical protein [Flavimarina sp. Hel_I_48]